jgi:DNA-binding LytR/AlgR family response regulator
MNSVKVHKIFIVENEAELAENIEDILNFSGHLVVGKEGDGEKALQSISKLNPDLILLDILLTGRLNGIDVAHKIREFTDIPIVFITGHSDRSYLDEIAFINHISFILKPFSKEVLNSIIYLAFLKQNKRLLSNNIYYVRDKGFIVPLKEFNIVMVKADGLYTRIFTKDKQYVVRDILKDVTAKLSEDTFVRIHKSYIVNLDHITGFNSKQVTVLNYIVPIRRGYFKELSQLLDDRVNSSKFLSSD